MRTLPSWPNISASAVGSVSLAIGALRVSGIGVPPQPKRWTRLLICGRLQARLRYGMSPRIAALSERRKGSTVKARYLLAISGCVFLAALTFFRLSSTEKHLAPRKAQPLKEFNGRITVIEPNLFQIGGRRVQLCGVLYSRSTLQRGAIMSETRKLLNHRGATCLPVGAGSICDGRSPPRIGTVVLAQCFYGRRLDIAEALVQRNLLCGDPAIRHYNTC